MAAQQEMSITQALAELKLVKKRFEGVLEDAQFVALKTKTRPVDTDKFSRSAQGSFQSFRDLLDRYNRIKAAIVASNATAQVTVGGRQYTISEAVERKRSIETERRCLALMQQQWQQVQRSYEHHNTTQQERLDKLVLQELGKDNKTSVEVVQNLTDAFWKNNKAEVVDPLGLEERIKTYSKEIEDFELNVDWVLSEANGRTMIRV